MGGYKNSITDIDDKVGIGIDEPDKKIHIKDSSEHIVAKFQGGKEVTLADGASIDIPLTQRCVYIINVRRTDGSVYMFTGIISYAFSTTMNLFTIFDNSFGYDVTAQTSGDIRITNTSGASRTFAITLNNLAQNI